MRNGKSDLCAGEDAPACGRQSLKRAFLIFFLTFLWSALFSFFGVDFHHDGVVMIPAMRIAGGEALFRDVFCQYGWLLPILQGGALKLFGAELLVLKLLNALFYALAALYLDKVWKRFLTPKTDWMPPLLFLLLLPDTLVTAHAWSSVPALWTLLATLHHLLRFREQGKNSSLLLSGIFAGATLLFRHPCGAAVLGAGTLLLLCEAGTFPAGGRKNHFFHTFSLFCVGFFLALLPALVTITFTGAWPDFFRQCFSYVFTFVRHRGDGCSWEYVCTSFFPFISSDLWLCNSIFALLPLTAIGFFLGALLSAMRQQGKRDFGEMLPLLGVILFSLASWHQYYPVPCVRHLFWGGVPMFGFLPLTIEKAWKERSHLCVPGRLWAVILSVSALLCAAPRVAGIWIRYSSFFNWRTSAVAGISGMRLSVGEYRFIRDFRQKAQELPEALRRKGIFNDTEDSLWTVLLPECRFRHPQFYRIRETPYPEYPAASQAFVFREKTAVFTDEPWRFPGWKIFFYAIYMGREYYLLIPEAAPGEPLR